MIELPKKKIMLCGMHERTLGKQDWDDTSYERWGLAHHRVRRNYFDRLFESHSPEIIMKHTPFHMDRIAAYVKEGVPVYSPWEFPDVPGLITISHDEVFGDIAHPSPRRFWESSISFPMALAMASGAEEIAIYGVDMSNPGGDLGGERLEQKHSMLYQIGLAEGMGIRVTIPDNCTLFDSRWTGGIYGHPKALDDIHYQLG